MLVTVNLDEETHALTKDWPNFSWQVREWIKEQAKGLRPICLQCGCNLYAEIGTPNLICLICCIKFQLVKRVE